MPRFEIDYGRDDLQAVLDSVSEFLQKRRDTVMRGRSLALQAHTIGDVIDCKQDLLCLVAGPRHLARTKDHYTLPDRWESAVHLKGLDSRMFGKNGFDQGAHFENIPLSVTELIEFATDVFLEPYRKRVAKRTVRKPDRQVR